MEADSSEAMAAALLATCLITVFASLLLTVLAGTLRTTVVVATTAFTMPFLTDCFLPDLLASFCLQAGHVNSYVSKSAI